MMNSPGTAQTFRSNPVNVAPAVVARLLLALACVAPAGAARGQDDRTPDLGDCQQLHVPTGNKVAFQAFGVGVQIYRWNGMSWTFVAPEAVLYADAGDNGEVGIHFGGPTWQSNSGSQVVGTSIDHCTPDPSAIPWLKLQSVPELTGGPGIFGHVTYIQRLHTVGGTAPAVPGDFPGQVARVPYSADYVFYRAGP
jgi:hypothetical protein